MAVDKNSAVLFELRGANPGGVHVIYGDVFRIGSDVENDLILQEREIALYQAEIRNLQGQFVIKNLSLESPAFLNGESFEASSLHKGDILTIGASLFRFIEFGETLKKDDLWAPVGGVESRKPGFRLTAYQRVSFLTLLTVFAVALVVVFMWMQRKQTRRDIPAGWQETAEIQEERLLDTIRYLYDHGVDLLAARRWDEAVLVFEEIQKDVPNYKDTDEYYQQAVVESAALDALNQGKGLASEGEQEQAV
jgi:hypothetical protein